MPSWKRLADARGGISRRIGMSTRARNRIPKAVRDPCCRTPLFVLEVHETRVYLCPVFPVLEREKELLAVGEKQGDEQGKTGKGNGVDKLTPDMREYW